ncbi:protein of unknown function (plasmid) [Caballeronia sp. S22]
MSAINASTSNGHNGPIFPIQQTLFPKIREEPQKNWKLRLMWRIMCAIFPVSASSGAARLTSARAFP